MTAYGNPALPSDPFVESWLNAIFNVQERFAQQAAWLKQRPEIFQELIGKPVEPMPREV